MVNSSIEKEKYIRYHTGNVGIQKNFGTARNIYPLNYEGLEYGWRRFDDLLKKPNLDLVGMINRVQA